MIDETDDASPSNDPERIVPEVYRQRLAKGLDHLEAFRTAVETYREIRPAADDDRAATAVNAILEAAGLHTEEAERRSD